MRREKTNLLNWITLNYTILWITILSLQSNDSTLKLKSFFFFQFSFSLRNWRYLYRVGWSLLLVLQNEIVKQGKKNYMMYSMVMVYLLLHAAVTYVSTMFVNVVVVFNWHETTYGWWYLLSWDHRQGAPSSHTILYLIEALIKCPWLGKQTESMMRERSNSIDNGRNIVGNSATTAIWTDWLLVDVTRSTSWPPPPSYCFPY